MSEKPKTNMEELREQVEEFTSKLELQAIEALKKTKGYKGKVYKKILLWIRNYNEDLYIKFKNKIEGQIPNISSYHDDVQKLFITGVMVEDVLKKISDIDEDNRDARIYTNLLALLDYQLSTGIWMRLMKKHVLNIYLKYVLEEG